MTIIKVMDRTLPLATIKARLSEIVDGVESQHDRVILTRNGRAAAVILHPDDLESLEETLDLLSTRVPSKRSEQRRMDIEAGNYLTAAEMRARFLEPVSRFALRVAPGAARSLERLPDPGWSCYCGVRHRAPLWKSRSGWANR